MNWINRIINKTRIKSPWLLHFDCGSCNGCDIETLACLTPVYDIERFGVINVGNPMHADILLVTGTVNPRNKKVLVNLYDQMPNPKVVVAIGSCGLSGGIFKDAYNVLGGIDKVIPVDVYVPGCPAKPEAIIDGVVMALKKYEVIKKKHSDSVPSRMKWRKIAP
ncbi:MAG: NADH-quinone oxidoreductase subunit B family protein [Desulfobacteraceae bacterium]|nr:NADH-quinone oxidoreductase subunit B family protein [Desulfobacteraceae bacterium]MBC2756101.1 NADH-quinone oxidoreductase subunit B family protein [Desulfobacteraceae bacterium]MBC2763742.1 NADH-quinone oxidoreductase subunit B family protein [ANME-2 cluster archaeon]